MAWLNILRLRFRMAIGALANLSGLPGFVRDCDYEAGITNARILVRTRDMFTVITVNGLDIYFHRLTGKIDGVGLTGRCISHRIPPVELSPDQVENRHPPIHT